MKLSGHSMKSSILVIFLMSAFGFASAQKILLVENSRSMKNLKYMEGQKIIVKVAGEEKKFHDRIAGFEADSIVLMNYGVTGLNEVEVIFRENWLVRTLQGLSLLGGTGYLALDSFNRLINGEGPVFQQETLIISGSMIAFSAALIPFKYRKIKIGERWTLQVIEMF